MHMILKTAVEYIKILFALSPSSMLRSALSKGGLDFGMFTKGVCECKPFMLRLAQHERLPLALYIRHTWQLVPGLLLLTLMTGCAEWNSVPVVVDENFGRAYHNMVKNQTLYPEHGQNDDPSLSLDGQKAEGIIKSYRSGTSKKLESAKEGVNVDIKNGQ